MTHERIRVVKMGSSKCVLARQLLSLSLMLVVAVDLFCAGCACKEIKVDPVETTLALYQHSPGPSRGYSEPEKLSRVESDAVLEIVPYVKFSRPQRGSPSPELYGLSGITVSGRSLDFKKDGTLVFASLPEEEKRELANIIRDVIKRMKPSTPWVTTGIPTCED